MATTDLVPAAGLRQRAARLAGLITTPLLPADYLDHVLPLRAGAVLRGRVVAVHAETPRAATVVIRPGSDWRGHLPGQYLRVGVDVDGVRHWRAYSITSPADRRDGLVAITVTAVPDGVVSNHLVNRARAGTLVRLEQAAGDFVLPTAMPRKLLFVTAGSGITPVMGMLRSSVHRMGDVVVLHSARTTDDVLFGAELRRLADAGRIRLVERHTSTDGRFDAQAIGRLVPDLVERSSWACGPASMLDALSIHWADRGVPGLLHVERFRPAVLAGGGDGGGTVSFARSNVAVDSDGTTSLLESGERAGVLMPSGCRMGICFGCVVPLREGVVRDVRDGAITSAASGDGVLIQTCVSAAAGDCDLDL